MCRGGRAAGTGGGQEEGGAEGDGGGEVQKLPPIFMLNSEINTTQVQGPHRGRRHHTEHEADCIQSD